MEVRALSSFGNEFALGKISLLLQTPLTKFKNKILFQNLLF